MIRSDSRLRYYGRDNLSFAILMFAVSHTRAGDDSEVVIFAQTRRSHFPIFRQLLPSSGRLYFAGGLDSTKE